jgi:DNA helicase-4
VSYMELKATSLGKYMAQHPYDRVSLLHAGLEVSGSKHRYLIPFNQLLNVHCKRGIVWGELEFELPDGKVVRLHGTPWQETQNFYRTLLKRWQSWSGEMSLVSQQVLAAENQAIALLQQQDKWITHQQLLNIQQNITASFASIPLPIARIGEFDNCRADYQVLTEWLVNGEQQVARYNQLWAEQKIEHYGEFFDVSATPLNDKQCFAMVNGEAAVFATGAAGTGKTSLVVARACWVLLRQEALAEQILMLAGAEQGAALLSQALTSRLQHQDIAVKTCRTLALTILQQTSRKAHSLTPLMEDSQARRQLLIDAWQKQCNEKKAQAKGWRECLEEGLNWQVPEGSFWHDAQFIERISVRLDRWFCAFRLRGVTQSQLLELVDPERLPQMQKWLRLFTPLLKAWKSELKQQNSLDDYALIQQAVNSLQKERFISPWKHILIDDVQQIPSVWWPLLSLLCKQNPHTCLFAVGDQAQLKLELPLEYDALDLHPLYQHFPHITSCTLEHSVRLPRDIAEISRAFLLREPRSANLFNRPNKQSMVHLHMLPDAQLQPLLDKLSGYVKPMQRILLLARYDSQCPQMLQKAHTRWPNLQIEFMDIENSCGQQADYTIVLGWQDHPDGLSACDPQDPFEQGIEPLSAAQLEARQRCLLYVALTRAREQTWLMYDGVEPSLLMRELQTLGGVLQKRP